MSSLRLLLQNVILNLETFLFYDSYDFFLRKHSHKKLRGSLITSTSPPCAAIRGTQVQVQL